MKKKQEGQALRRVRRALNRWNPYGCLPESAPEDDDEFAGEARAIVRGLPRVKSEKDMCLLVSRVFTSSFGEADRFAPSNCASLAEALLRELRAERLI